MLKKKFDMSVVVPRVTPVLPGLFKLNNNPGDLDPERIISREIGYIGKVGSLNIDARLFHDNLDDLLSTENEPYVAPPGLFLLSRQKDIEGYINQGGAEVNGFETQVKWDITRKNKSFVELCTCQDTW